MHKKNKIISALILSLTVNSFFVANVSASETKFSINCDSSSVSLNLKDCYLKDNAFCKTLINDYAKHQTTLSPLKERKLNELGLTDGEILELGEDALVAIEDSVNTTILINYYGEREDGEFEQLSDGEVAMLESQLSSSQAASVPKHDFSVGTTTFDSGKLKEVVAITQNQINGPMDCFCTYNWLVRPQNTTNDFAGVSFKNLVITSDITCTHSATEVRQKYSEKGPGDIISEKKLITNPTTRYVDNGEYVFYRVNLFTNKSSNSTITYYRDEIIRIQFSGKMIGKSIDYCTLTAYYLHCQSSVEFAPGLSIDKSGMPSVSASVAVKLVYKLVPNNVSLTYEYWR